MTRIIIKQTKRYQIFIKVFRLGKKTKIIEYTHSLGSVEKNIFEEKSHDLFNYTTKDHKEQLRKNKEFLENIKSIEVNHVKV